MGVCSNRLLTRLIKLSLAKFFKFIHGTKELSGQLDRVKFDWDGGTSFDGGYMRYVKIEDL